MATSRLSSTAETVFYDLDMDEVAAELYAALQYIESLQTAPSHAPLPAARTATPETENEQ
ncbi:hypothetical protein ACIG0A_33320 [Streptomyces californicus]|uniref:hypothetical protein n=1 Tax=Streptomyces californicus TaxID=67351 RepID=UPI0037D27CB7